jgi:three-Cys-motif partner protein
MVAIQDYQGREQSYVKHVFLERYLERLVHKTASSYDHIVYVDGFAGPWQSASERFQDTSFGIALNALRQAKATWKAASRDVKMSAYLVEQDRVAYATRHPKGIEVFRDCQLKTLQEQAKTRAATKVKHAETTTGQREIFESLHDMAPNDLGTKLAAAKAAAEKTLLELTPAAPAAVKYEHVWPRVLAKT